VKPGILVRQRYTDADIGRAKASALKARLEALGLQCAVTSEIYDLAESALARFTSDQWDLVIDATASASVHHRLERELAELALAAPLLSLSVSAAASHGSVAVKMPDYRGGPHRIARQVKLEAFARDAGHSLVKAFWPAREEMNIFQPEPGCSAPTFIGSAADIDHHAAGLLNVGLLRAKELSRNQASVDLIAAPWLDANTSERPRLSYAFAGYEQTVEQRHGYTILRSAAAANEMLAELRRIARTRSNKVETGGLMFGEVDDSYRHIWIDSVGGAPPDSKASPAQFLCGTAGTKELAAFKAKASGDSSKFVGIWHTHPISRGSPSDDDLHAMLQLLHFQEFTPRHVVMLILGFAATKPVENYYLYRRNEFKLIAVAEQDQEGAV
jgi:proteasome lid subunit RPN8/RPN11